MLQWLVQHQFHAGSGLEMRVHAHDGLFTVNLDPELGAAGVPVTDIVAISHTDAGPFIEDLFRKGLK